MKIWKLSLGGIVIAGVLALVAFSFRRAKVSVGERTAFEIPKGCVYRTVMGEESSLGAWKYKTPEAVQRAMDEGLQWIAKAQHGDGGWGAGSHARQDVIDPHAVSPDPATTSMVAMALLRSGSTLETGNYSTPLRRAVNYLLETTESSPASSLNITNVTGTQIQSKLGVNIDVILTAQFFSNLLEDLNESSPVRSRVKAALDKCVSKIQRAQDGNGAIAGSGWAGVLQSSFATNALEAAQAQGADVDEEALARAREFQKGNYDPKSGDVNTDMGAGIMLYSVSGSARASAKEARKVKEDIEAAKRRGRIGDNAPASAETLERMGYDKADAIKYATAYEVYESAKVQSRREDVMSGFGNNGGEEFLSYLQTGEGLIIGKDNTWKSWYDDMSGRLLKIQNDNGSWSGHHCITSPVFCTATCLLILSVNNDVEALIRQGGY